MRDYYTQGNTISEQEYLRNEILSLRKLLASRKHKLQRITGINYLGHDLWTLTLNPKEGDVLTYSKGIWNKRSNINPIEHRKIDMQSVGYVKGEKNKKVSIVEIYNPTKGDILEYNGVNWSLDRIIDDPFIFDTYWNPQEFV